MAETKKCPMCDGEILEVANKCEHCKQGLILTEEILSEIPSSQTIVQSSPGAIDQKLLQLFMADLQLDQDESIFFFQTSEDRAPGSSGLSGLLEPNLHILVSNKRVLAIAKDKNGKIYKEMIDFCNLKHASLIKGRRINRLEFVIADPGQRVAKYSFTVHVNRDALDAVVSHIENCKGGFDKNVFVVTSSNKTELAEKSPEEIPAEIPSSQTIVQSFPGAIDQESLQVFIADLQLDSEESIFFFQTSKERAPKSSGLAGFFKPNLHILVSNKRVLAVAKDKNGAIYKEMIEFCNLKLANVTQQTMNFNRLIFVVADPVQRIVKYHFSGDVKRHILDAVVSHIENCKGGFDKNVFVGPIDQKLLQVFMADLQLDQGESIFFFQEAIQRAPKSSGLAGFLKPNLHILVSNKRVLAVAKDKNGEIYKEIIEFWNLKLAYVTGKIMGYHSLQFVVADPVQRMVTYSFYAIDERAALDAVVSYVADCKAKLTEFQCIVILLCRCVVSYIADCKAKLTELLSNYAAKTAREIVLDTGLSHDEKLFLLEEACKLKRDDVQRLLTTNEMLIIAGPLDWLNDRIDKKKIQFLLRTLEGVSCKEAEKIADFKWGELVLDVNMLRNANNLDPKIKKLLLTKLHKVNLSNEDYTAMVADFERTEESKRLVENEQLMAKERKRLSEERQLLKQIMEEERKRLMEKERKRLMKEKRKRLSEERQLLKQIMEEERKKLKIDRLRQRARQKLLEAEFEKVPENTKIRNIPDEVKELVWRRDQGKCIKCESQEKLEFDHIIPFSKGGSNTARNIQLLCEACNRKKKDII